MPPTILYGFWASSCTWRARAALVLKRVPFEERAVEIARAHDQLTDRFRAINPAQKVPALQIDGHTLVESMAILQYLEETRPEPTLSPSTPLLRARMREVVEIIVSGIQPLQNMGLRPHFATEDKFHQFGQHQTDRGLQTLEELLVKSSGLYCVGDQLTMADLCFIPQVFNAVGRLKLDIGKFATISRLYSSLLKEQLFAETHPFKIKNLKWDFSVHFYFINCPLKALLLNSITRIV